MPKTVKKPQTIQAPISPSEPALSLTLEELQARCSRVPALVVGACRRLAKMGYTSQNVTVEPLIKDGEPMTAEALIIDLIKMDDEEMKNLAIYLMWKLNSPSHIGSQLYFAMQLAQKENE